MVEQVDEKIFWIWLSQIPGIGARRFHFLIEYFGSANQVWLAPKNEIVKLTSSLGSNVVHKIINQRNDNTLDRIKRMMDLPEFRIITLLDDEYPTLLKEIYDPPPVLYCKGLPIKNHQSSISIVGSRKSTAYGRQMAEKFSYELAEAGITVVSGLARGIDALAHYGALKAGGNTVGVLGCGIDIIYPPENRKLFSKMEQEGTIITEYPPGSSPVAGNFPARNRIISGMTSGVLVIEAGQKSGALITVDFALEQGREVYALPGNINVPQSAGTNKLLKEGAKLVTDVQDILEDLGIQREKDKKDQVPVQLDFFETQVYNALQEGERHLEELLKETKMDIHKLNAVLTMLEVKGIVKQMPGKIFIRNWDA
ncbi:MAG: DNA-protecting protein DprA [Clostridiales bacterium]|nr:DNA-protecting protein DprA [Clostridiales bacterium]